MLSIPKRIKDAMAESSSAGAVKIGVKPFDFPEESNEINFGQFNGDPVYENATTLGARACCAYDGSLNFLVDSPVVARSTGVIWAYDTICIRAGDCSEIRVYCFANSNVRVAVYTGTTLLAESNSTAITAGAWRSVALTSTVAMTLGATYVVAVQCQTNYAIGTYISVSPHTYRIQSQAYGAFPNPATWYTSAGNYHGVLAKAYDVSGNLLTTDNSESIITRFENPSPDTDYTELGASGAASFNNNARSAILSNPTSAEVMAFRYFVNKVQYRQSNDNGGTWGDWTDILALSSCTFLRACYDDSGDIVVFYYTTSSHGIGWVKRTSGSWGGSWSTDTLSDDTDYFFLAQYDGSRATPTVYNVEITYDTDWFVIINWQQNNQIDNSPVKYQYKWAVYFGTIDASTLAWLDGGQVNISDVKGLITSISQISSMTGSATTFRDLPDTLEQRIKASQNYLSLGKTYTVNDFIANTSYTTEEQTYPYSYLIKLSNYPITLGIWDKGKYHIFTMREDADIADGLFSTAFSITIPYPVNLCANDEYVFGYNGNQIFVWPRPYKWEKPTIGTGAGTEFNPDSTRILAIQNVVQDQAAQSIVTLNNYDYYFHTLTGDLAGFVNGSEVDIYRGYYDSSTPVTMVSDKVFIEQIAYARQPNLPLFKLKCVNAWRLLDRYKFPRRVRFNYLGASTTYTVYEIIEMLVNTIGGTLSYDSRSSFITTFTPRVELQAGETAANLLRRLISICPDVIKFQGVDGVIVYPQTTDAPVATFIFPSRVKTESTFNSFNFNAAQFNDGEEVYYPTIYSPLEYGESPRQINRVVIVGMDDDSNHVMGQAKDTTINGEMLDPYYESMVTTSANAETVADNMLAKQRLMINRGQIVITSHPGLEQWDVINCIDADCNQAARFRIAGMQFYYQSSTLGQYRHEHILQLTGV